MPEKPASDHRWYRAHWLTWTVLLLVGGGLFYVQFLHVHWIFHGMQLHYSLGWPRAFTVESSTPAGPFRVVYWGSLAFDVGWWLATTALPVFFAERLARRRFQFSLRGLLGASVVAAWALSRISWSEAATLCATPNGVVFVVLVVFTGYCWFLAIAWVICRACELAYARVRLRRSRAKREPPERPVDEGSLQ